VTVAESEVSLASRRRRRWSRHRVMGAVAPYALLAPAAVVLGAVLFYPLYLIARLSFEKYGLFELIRHQGKWIGLDNYTQIIHDGQFWRVLVRTIVFTAVNVSLTMVLGTGIALLLVKVSGVVRYMLTGALVFVWATPVVVAVDVWRWIVDPQFGILNWALTKLHAGDFFHHDWFVNPWSGFAVITALVVWGAIPFVAITVFAGLSQAWNVFREVTLPLLKPIFVILTSLSIIWDFQVFNQIWIMLDQRPSSDYYLMSVYSFVESFRLSEYGLGSAIAVVMVLIMFAVTFVYIRQMVKAGEVR
jgi:N,N'-diacetylchitobiose transport system permease protein